MPAKYVAPGLVSELKTGKHRYLAIGKDNYSRHGWNGKVSCQVATVLRHHLQDPQAGLVAGVIAARLHLFQHFCHILASTGPE